MAKYAGIDALLQVSISSSFTTIGQVRDIKGPSMALNPIEVTTRDSTSKHKEYIAGLREAGEVTFDLVLDGDLATHSMTVAGGLGTYLQAGTIGSYKLTFADVSPVVATFSALVIKYEPELPYAAEQKASATLRITGVITWA